MACCVGTTPFSDPGSKNTKQEVKKKGSILTRSLWNLIRQTEKRTPKKSERVFLRDTLPTTLLLFFAFLVFSSMRD